MTIGTDHTRPLKSPPKKYGRYRVLDALGEGAMGSVYLARDELLGRDVAVKTIHAGLGLSGAAMEMFMERFTNEARAIAAISHPSILRVYDMGVDDGTPYLVMELVAGKSLRARIDDAGRLDPAEVRGLGVQIARALDAAHARGILHRDVKPANILEDTPGSWKLADFGVAHVPDSSLTIAGQFLGTPAYSAPEAILSGKFGPTTDVFSLGATLYEALAGQAPFAGGKKTIAEMAAKRELPSLIRVRQDVSPELDTIILRALAAEPEERPSAAAFAEALANAATPGYAAGLAPAASAPGGVPAGALAVGAAAAGAAGRSFPGGPPGSPGAGPPAPPAHGSMVGPAVAYDGTMAATPGAVAQAASPSRFPTPLPYDARHASAVGVPPGASSPGLPAAYGSVGVPGVGPGGTYIPPPPYATAPPQPQAGSRKGLIYGLGGVVVLLLIVTIALATSKGGDKKPATTAGAWGGSPGAGSGQQRSPAGWGGGESQAERNRRHQKRWEKVREKLERGEIHKAKDELERLVEENPEDEEARALLDQLEAGGPVRIIYED